MLIIKKVIIFIVKTIYKLKFHTFTLVFKFDFNTVRLIAFITNNNICFVSTYISKVYK